MTASTAFEGVLAALLHRERTGEGQLVTVNMLDAITTLQMQELSVFTVAHKPQQRSAEPHAHVYIRAPYGAFATSDGYIIVAFPQLRKFGELIGEPSFLDMDDEVDTWTRRDEIYAKHAGAAEAQDHGGMAGPVPRQRHLGRQGLRLCRPRADPQIAHNGTFVEYDHPTEGHVKTPGFPYKFSKTPPAVDRGAPLAGEHTRDVLREAGYDEARIAALMAGGAVGETEAVSDVTFAIDGHVATITLNRPQKLNAVTPEMADAVVQAVEHCNGDDAVRCVIVTGAGEKAFCAGSDIAELDRYETPWEFRNRPDYCDAIRRLLKPSIAAVNGYAFGGGLETALSCDIRIASANARFAAPEIKLGWIGGGGMTAFLAQHIGPSNTALMIMTGDPVDAQAGARLGARQRGDGASGADGPGPRAGHDDCQPRAHRRRDREGQSARRLLHAARQGDRIRARPADHLLRDGRTPPRAAPPSRRSGRRCSGGGEPLTVIASAAKQPRPVRRFRHTRLGCFVAASSQ